MIDFIRKPRYTLPDLIRLVHVLRAPGGCPWDAAQTHLSIRRNFLEEAYEACEALDKLAEEAQELREAVQDDTNIDEELGDLLFAAVRVASTLDKDPEQALHSACEKFIKRFTAMEQSILASGRTLEELSREELLASWDAQKRNGR